METKINNMLGIKQREKNNNFLSVLNNIEKYISKKQIENKINKTIFDIKKNVSNKKIGQAWSGGKDSVVLDFVLKEAIGEYPSVIGMTRELEYPEFMQFVTDNMPNDLTVHMTNHTIKWLSEHIDYLFPQNSNIASKWFKMVQHKAQDTFFKEQKLDILCTGRRKLDCNYIGTNGLYVNKNTKVLRYSPIYDWTHEEVLGCIIYFNLPMAPFYKWKNGFIVGSGNWAARQWTGDIQSAWNEVYSIDQSIVKKASKYIQSAEIYVRNMGL